MPWLPRTKIVVPLDFSEAAFAALDVAREMTARPIDLHVVHVLPDLLPLDLGSWGDKVPADVTAEVDKLRPQLLDGTLNPYTGPIVDNKGEERLADGETLDEQQAYLVDWAVEGVSGVEG